MELTRVLSMAGNSGEMDGCYMWRVFQPTAELNRQGFSNVGWDYFNNPLSGIVWKLFDAISLPRLSWEPEDIEAENRWFNLIHSAGKAVIYEVDDDLFGNNFVHRMVNTHNKTPERAETVRQSITRAMQRCDGVTVSSEYLRVLIEGLTDRPVMVVPNFIDLRWFGDFVKNERRVIKDLTIGWAGGARPDTDVEAMATAWGRIAEMHPHVKFVLMGHQAKIIYDSVPPDRIRPIQWMPITDYPAGIMNIDIGCCPLSSEPFNRSKTYIKAMEYAALGAAVVASPTVYTQIINHGKNGFICETADEWTEALDYLVSSANRRNRMAQALYGTVAKFHSLEGNAWRWLEAWNSIFIDFNNRQRNRIVLPGSSRISV